MIQYLFGCASGAVVISAAWALYLAVFPNDSAALGKKVRTWIRLPPLP